MANGSVQSRATIRKAVANMLRTDLGSAVQHVYAYQVSRLDKQSPVIAVVSDGIVRDLATPTDQIQVAVHIFVRYQDEDSTPPWTEEASEDKIDEIEQKVMNSVLLHGDNQDGINASYPWITLDPTGMSTITRAIFEGIDYRHEQIILAAEGINVQ